MTELDELNAKTGELIRKLDEASTLAKHYAEKREKIFSELVELKEKASDDGYRYERNSNESKWVKKESK